MIRIAMWSGPRSISTAIMRSFENRPDTFVSDEPFYAHYLQKTGIGHPLREEVVASGNSDWNSVIDIITGPIPKGKNIWYQKHMAHHNLPGNDLGWVYKMKNILLIRHPREVILSYIKKHEVQDISQLGYSQQMEMFNIQENIGKTPLIIDARDVLENPKVALTKICKWLNIPFYKEMLSWPAGPRDSDGVWGKHWYGSVESSTSFLKYQVNNDSLPKKYDLLFSACMKPYQQLYQHRMRLE